MVDVSANATALTPNALDGPIRGFFWGFALQLRSLSDEFLSQRPRYERLAAASRALVEHALLDGKINYNFVESRVKAVNSLLRKAKSKGYKEPLKEITDLVGVRVVLYLESDIPTAEQALRACFDVDEDNSSNRLLPAAVNSVGYRSLHLVCCLGPRRASLPEYSGIADVPLEIQIRTTLQHAWAEIEHDRSYKLDGSLPPDLQRRLALVAASLELIDREFASIAEAADAYAKKLKETGSAEDFDDQISELAVASIIERELAAKGRPAIVRRDTSWAHKLVEELKDYGVSTVKEFDKLLQKHSYIFYDMDIKRQTLIGIVRDLMILDDAEKYFETSYKQSWGAIDKKDADYLAEKVGADKLRALLEEHGIIWESSEDTDSTQQSDQNWRLL
jgi:putative GTP pyrophosphokinase